MNGQLYIETGDDFTNEKVFELIAQLSETSTSSMKMCADRRERNLIAVSEKVMATCVASRSHGNSGLKFDTFQDSEEGIVPVTVEVKDPQDQPSTSSLTSLANLDPAEIRRALCIVPTGRGKWKCAKERKAPAGGLSRQKATRKQRVRTLPIGAKPFNACRVSGPKPKKGTIRVKASLSIRTES